MMSGMSTHDLFGLDPSDFVAAREKVARELKASGDKDEAKAVHALRRPSVSAWALNQVARHAPDAINDLLSAAEEARSAQDVVLAGGEGDVLRDALARRRGAMRAVVHRARDVVDASGRSGEGQEREIESALNAIVDSPALTEALRQGELTDVRGADEDDDLSSMFAAPTGGTEPKHAKKATGEDRAAAKRIAAREAVERLEVEAREAADRLTVAEQAADAADADLARAQDAARSAGQESTAARRAHDKAVGALERAQQALAKLGD